MATPQILDVLQGPLMDNAITGFEYHNYEPYISGKFDYNDEIRIPIQELDAYTFPHASYLYIEGKLTKDDGTVATKLRFINNAIAYMFREIRISFAGVDIDITRGVGIATTLKGYLSYNLNESNRLNNAGWIPFNERKDKILVDDNGNFNVCIPLKMLMGFFEDYRKIIVNMKQELVLIRANDDVDIVTADDRTEKPKVTINKIFWRVPHVTLDIPQQLALSKLVDKNVDIVMAFRSWELIEYPSLPQTDRFTWPVKTTTKLETPRHVIIAFQTSKKGDLVQDMSQFDHCNLTNVRVFLNSKRYPYNDLHLNFKENKFASLYEMYSAFRHSYYESENEPILKPTEFREISPLVHIDCSRQKETIQAGAVVMRIEFETSENIKENTTAYCLILHDKIFSYNPLTKIIRQL